MVSAQKGLNVAKKHVKGKIALISGVLITPVAVFILLIVLIVASFSTQTAAEDSQDPYKAECATTGIMTGVTFGGQMDIVLRTLRIVESGENYTSQSKSSSASGAYQFIDRTWNGYKTLWAPSGDFSGGAYLAPASVQDIVAKKKVEGILAENSVEVVGPTWMTGHVPKGAEWDSPGGKVGAPKGSNPTPRQYQAKWMKIYNFLVSVTPKTEFSAQPASSSYGSADAAERSIKSFSRKPIPSDNIQINDMFIGFASTYGNDPQTGVVDGVDNNTPALGGHTNAQPAIAVYNQGTLGGWWQVTAPNSRTVVLQQTDIGPSTDRMIDINAVAARSAFGYPAASFPTDQGSWSAIYLGKEAPSSAVFLDTKGVGDAQVDPSTEAAVPLTCNPESVGTEDGTPVVNANLPTGPVSSDVIVNVYGINIHKDIAPNLQAMMDAMRAAGLKPGGGGYRDPVGQINVRRNNCGTSHYAIYEMKSSACSPPTAKPGTSMHEKGLAIDFTCGGGTLKSGSACFNWLKINAANYGFINYPVEPWHWSTNGH